MQVIFATASVKLAFSFSINDTEKEEFARFIGQLLWYYDNSQNCQEKEL